MSGIKAGLKCNEAYEDVKHRKTAFAIFHIAKDEGSDHQEIQPEYVESSAEFSKLVYLPFIV